MRGRGPGRRAEVEGVHGLDQAGERRDREGVVRRRTAVVAEQDLAGVEVVEQRVGLQPLGGVPQRAEDLEEVVEQQISQAQPQGGAGAIEGALRLATRGGHEVAGVEIAPHNPTGRVLTRAEMSLIAELCERHDAWVITDEPYEHIRYAGDHHVMATFPNMRERTITISSLSKTFSITGWRLGYAVAPAAQTAAIRKVHDFLTVGAPAPLQDAVAAANRSTISKRRSSTGSRSAARSLRRSSILRRERSTCRLH